MTRTYALQRLLQHGELRRGDLIRVTGWSERDLDKALTWAVGSGKVERAVQKGCPRFVYRLPAAHYMREAA